MARVEHDRRDPAQEKNLARPDVRIKIGEYIDGLKAADEKALAMMKELSTAI